jgi:hypothetical protein
MFRTVPLSIIRSFFCAHSNGICHTACEQDQDVSSWSCSQAISKPVWHTPLLRLQWKTPDDGQRNCPKHVEFNSKNKSEKSVHLVGFIIRNFSRCTVTWTSSTEYYVNVQQVHSVLLSYVTTCFSLFIVLFKKGCIAVLCTLKSLC